MSPEPLNSVQEALADGIAARVVAAMREDAAATPVRLLQAEMARRIAASLHEEGSAKSLARAGRPEADEPAVMSVPEFCALPTDVAALPQLFPAHPRHRPHQGQPALGKPGRSCGLSNKNINIGGG